MVKKDSNCKRIPNILQNFRTSSCPVDHFPSLDSRKSVLSFWVRKCLAMRDRKFAQTTTSILLPLGLQSLPFGKRGERARERKWGGSSLGQLRKSRLLFFAPQHHADTRNGYMAIESIIIHIFNYRFILR